MMIRLWSFRMNINPRSSKMKQELLAKIQELTAQRDALSAQIDAETTKLNQMMADIPAEFHNMDQATFDKLKAYFN